MKKFIFLPFVLVGAVIIMSSCGDTTSVGSGLVADDEIQVEHIEDFVIKAKSVISAPDITFTRNEILTPTIHYAGTYNDPIFGSVESSFYVQNRYFNSFSPPYAGEELDSLMLTMRFEPAATFGDSLASFDIEIYRLLQNIDDLDSIRSDANFPISAEPIATVRNVQPGYFDTLTYFDPVIGDTISSVGSIRVKLSQRFAAELFNSTTAIGSDENLLSQFNGFYIKAYSPDNSLIGFNLPQSSVNNLLSMYYSKLNGIERTPSRFDYFLGYIRPIKFTHDYSATDIPNIVDKEAEGEDLLYLQGFSGLDIELDLADVLKLANSNPLINFATLEVTVATQSIPDLDSNPSAGALGLYKLNEEGQKEKILDLQLGELSLSRESLFGGSLQQDTENASLLTYKMNLTSHVKNILKGIESTKVYLSVYNNTANPTRTILYGPQHSLYPVKLRVTYTKP